MIPEETHEISGRKSVAVYVDGVGKTNFAITKSWGIYCEGNPVPDREGLWRIDYLVVTATDPCTRFATAWAEDSLEVDVYKLEPVGGELCVWSDDIGGCINGPSDVWSTDEWLGHIPVSLLPLHFMNARFTFLCSFDT